MKAASFAISILFVAGSLLLGAGCIMESTLEEEDIHWSEYENETDNQENLVLETDGYDQNVETANATECWEVQGNYCTSSSQCGFDGVCRPWGTPWPVCVCL